MSADDLSAPLGKDVKRRLRFPIALSRALPQVVGAALAIFLGVFVLWAILSDDPFGGEPMVAVPIDLHAAMAPKKSAMAINAASSSNCDSGASTSNITTPRRPPRKGQYRTQPRSGGTPERR